MRVWLVIKEQQIFDGNIPTGEFMPDEYQGVFTTRKEALNVCKELADIYFKEADYVSELSGGFGYYAEKRVRDEYVFWQSYKIEPVNSYL